MVQALACLESDEMTAQTVAELQRAELQYARLLDSFDFEEEQEEVNLC